jgi:MFS transporter, DHA1 family, multidrug resistance protein
VADLATGAEAQRAMSFISTVFGLAPAIAPIIGGWMLSAWGWRSIFYFIASFTLLLFIACFWRLPESLAKEQRQEFHPIVILRAYWQVGGHLEFMLRAIAIALTFSGIMLYVAAAPTFVLDILHLEVTQFAWMFIPIIGGMTLGSYLSGRWADTIEPTRLIGAGFTIMLVSASINVLYSAFFTVQIPWAVVPLFTYAFGANLIVPTMTLMGLEMFPGVRGMASSLQTFLFMLLFSLESGVIVPLLYGDPLRLSGGVLVGAVLSVVCWRLAGRLTETK